LRREGNKKQRREGNERRAEGTGHGTEKGGRREDKEGVHGKGRVGVQKSRPHGHFQKSAPMADAT